MSDEYPTNIANDYQIDPSFNKDLILSYRPPPKINLSKLPALNKNWIRELETIICQADPSLPKKILDRHLGTESNYRAKAHLTKQLQLICHRFQGNLDSELGELSLDDHKALINKLTEEINYCSEGFHNRVNIIVDLFYKPRNLAELLCMMRKEMVERIASALTDEVHAWNRVSVIANIDGLGVKANFSEDAYSGSLTDASIRRTLQNYFHQKFTPFQIPSFLIVTFINFIPELEAEKNNKNGLSQEMREKITTLIQHFLPDFINDIPNHTHYWLNYFEVGADQRLINIHWEKLYRSFFYALSNHHYFKNPQPSRLIDSAYHHLFLAKNPNSMPNLLISKLFKEEKYSNLLEQLETLSERFPIYYQKISKAKVFSKNGLAFLDYLTRQLKISNRYSSEILLGFQLIINLDLRRKNFLIEKLAGTLLLRNQSGFNLLMLAVQHNPSFVNDILNFFKLNKKIIDPKLIKKIFLIKNKHNLNVLMIAAMHHPESLETMLEFIGKNIQDFANDLQAIFLEKHNNYNLLTLAASKEAVDVLVRFFNQYIYSFTKKIFFSLFTQKQEDSHNALTVTVRNYPDKLDNILESILNYLRIEGEILNANGACTILMLAAKNHAQATFSIFDFISKNIQNFDPHILGKMFLEKDPDGFTILMLAARYQPEALERILWFIDTHHDLFPKEQISELFLETSPENYNSLMLAAEFQPTSVETILNFIKNKLNFFRNDTLNILFTKNKKGCNSLMLARHHPAALDSILNFLSLSSSKGIIPNTLENLFLEKHKSEFTLMMYIARDQAESMDTLLKFIEKNEKQFSDATLYYLILEKNTLDYNCLMLAARNQYAAVSSILKFIQRRPQIFSTYTLQYLFLTQTEQGINLLMVAAQYQTEAVKPILDFIQAQPEVFSAEFLNQLLIAHDQYGVNALMLAATYQSSVVELLLSFVTKNIQHIEHHTLQEFIFKDIHDKQAANAVFFGGGYNFRKTILSVTSQLDDPTAVNNLLKFIDQHIDLLGIKVFMKLLTEQDKAKSYIFNSVCSRYPDTMKNILNFIATPDCFGILKPVHHLVADFIFDQLIRWPIKTVNDRNLFDKIISNCSTLLLNHFHLDRFGEHFDNLKKLSETLLSHLICELEHKKTKEQQYFFFRWFSYTEQELQAAKQLKSVLESDRKYKRVAFIKTLEDKHPRFLKSKSILSHLYAAFIKIEELKAEETNEADYENDDALPLQLRRLA